MAEITLILGGTRSGKSLLAEKHAQAAKRNVVYLATCRPGDDELLERIRRHRVRRPAHWLTIEEPFDPDMVFSESRGEERLVILECLSFLIFNWMERGDSNDTITASIKRLLEAAHNSKDALIVVSNEVGFSLIAPDPVSRRYQEVLGRANQQVAAEAERVILAIAGLPLVVKPVSP